MASLDLLAGHDGLHATSGFAQLQAALGARAQQNTAATVATAAPTVSGGDGTYTYQWALIDPDGDDRVALFTGSDTDADPGGWDTDAPGNWIETVTVTDGEGTVNVATRIVQIGDDDGFIHIDLSAGTETNAGMKGPGTVLGVAGTYEVAATHGLPDSTMDAYFNGTQLLARKAGQNRTIGRLYSPTAAPEDPGSSYACIGLGFGPDATPATNEGYHAALTQTGVPAQRAGACKRWGVEPTATAPDLGAGPYYVELDVSFDGTQAIGAKATYIGASDSLVLDEDVQATGTFTNTWLIAYMGQKGVAPASTVEWPSGTIFSYKHA